MIGKVFTHNGVTLRIHAKVGSQYELRSTATCGVWFATLDQLAAAGVTL